MDLFGKRVQTLKNPERLIWPLQSTLSVIFACFKARGSIAGVSETSLGTVLSRISKRKKRRIHRNLHLTSEISRLRMLKQSEQVTGLD